MELDILRISIVGMLFFSGLLKLIYRKYTIATIASIKVFPQKLEPLVGNLMPFVELGLALGMLLIESPLVTLLVMAYLLFFIAMNLRFIYDQKKCCCYGKLIRSELGLGGVIHYIYWAIIVIIDSFFVWDITPTTIYQYIVTLLLAIVIIVNSLIIRRLVEVTYNH